MAGGDRKRNSIADHAADDKKRSDDNKSDGSPAASRTQYDAVEDSAGPQQPHRQGNSEGTPLYRLSGKN